MLVMSCVAALPVFLFNGFIHRLIHSFNHSSFIHSFNHSCLHSHFITSVCCTRWPWRFSTLPIGELSHWLSSASGWSIYLLGAVRFFVSLLCLFLPWWFRDTVFVVMGSMTCVPSSPAFLFTTCVGKFQGDLPRLPITRSLSSNAMEARARHSRCECRDSITDRLFLL